MHLQYIARYYIANMHLYRVSGKSVKINSPRLIDIEKFQKETKKKTTFYQNFDLKLKNQKMFLNFLFTKNGIFNLKKKLWNFYKIWILEYCETNLEF